ncbi:MAG: DUF3078 domain-containing protein [Bacteroidota bacterium]|nr:DUF3078 domain-containing protein [Bacteroidota bacterium]
MKKIVTLIILTLFFNSQAQEPLILQPMKQDSVAPSKKDTSWKTSGFFGVNFSQTALSNWQGGGQDNFAVNSILNLQANYVKGKHSWINKLDAQYGLIRTGDDKLFKKNIDQLFALSKYNLDAFNKYWFYALQADYRTQFAPGYNYSGDSIVGTARSDFNSPGYIQLALGLDFKPTNYFSATFAPIAGKVTIVNRQYLADEGAYGVEKAVLDSSGAVVTHGKRIRTEFGGRVILKFKKDIFKNVNLDSYLDLFSSYGNNPGNIDVVFNNLLTFKINKYFTANVISQILYDDDVITVRDWNKDGKYDNANDIYGPRVQMLTTLAIGFGYKF